MEKVTAYKSYNGRLFESEEKCLAYENKMKKYPKVKESVEYGEQYDINLMKEITFNKVEKHTIITQNSPSGLKKMEIFYLIDKKYKLHDDFNTLDGELMHDIMIPRERKPYLPDAKGHCYDDGSKPSEYYAPMNVCRILARKLLYGIEVEQAIKQCIAEFKEFAPKQNELLGCEVIDGKHWVIENKRWHSGVTKPNRLHIELVS